MEWSYRGPISSAAGRQELERLVRPQSSRSVWIAADARLPFPREPHAGGRH